jgi:hypothetical protein
VNYTAGIEQLGLSPLENGWKIRFLEEKPNTYQHYQQDSNSGKEGREA